MDTLCIGITQCDETGYKEREKWLQSETSLSLQSAIKSVIKCDKKNCRVKQVAWLHKVARLDHKVGITLDYKV